MPPEESERAKRLAMGVLVASMVASALLFLVLGTQMTFWSDEIGWLTATDDFGIRGLLIPHGSHLIAIPRVIYEGLPRIFGTSYFPFRVLAIISLQAGAVLTFVLLRRRVGTVVAVFPAIVLLFFGSAHEIVVSPLGIPFTLSIALGLAAFATVELNRPRTDVAAMSLLILAGLTHTFGTICAIGVLVYMLVDRGRRREAWVALVPLLLWVAWWLWARQFDQSITDPSNIVGLPVFLVKAAGGALQSIFGVPVGTEYIGSTVSNVMRGAFMVLAVVGGIALAIRMRRGPTGPWVWAYVATLIAFWIGIGLSEGDGRTATTTRYLYFGAIMLILIVGELMRGRAIPARARPWLLAAFGVALFANVVLFVHSAREIDRDAAWVRSQLTAIGISGGELPQGARIAYPADVAGAFPSGTEIAASPIALERLRSEVGSTGFSLEELERQPDVIRRATDLMIVRNLATAVVPLPATTIPTTCRTYRPESDGYSQFPLVGGINILHLPSDSGEPGSTLMIGRYADAASVPIGEIPAEGAVAVGLPSDDAPRPWVGRAAGPVEVCGGAKSAKAGKGGGGNGGGRR